MGLFDKLFGESKKKSISPQQKQSMANKIISLSKDCIANLETEFKPTSQNGKFEIFMLNLEFFTQFLLDHDYISDEKDFRFLLIYMLMSDEDNPLISYTDEQFIEYYSHRTALIKHEISSLVKAMRSGGKMFIPVFSYASIYHTPLVNEPEIGFADFKDEKSFDAFEMEEASSFVSSYANHLSYIANKINSLYPA